MSAAEPFFNAYIDANILAVLAFVLWRLARLALDRAGMRHAYDTQLRLLNGVFLAIVASPFAVAAYRSAQQAGLMAKGWSVNLTDVAVAAYLDGSIAMRPADFQRVLDLRTLVTRDLLALDSALSMAVMVSLAVGSLILALVLGRNIGRLRAIVGSSYHWRRFGRVELRVSDRAAVPFSTRGLRRHYILVPEAMLADAANLRIALAHEFQHLRQHDVEWELTLEALRPLLFWNPVFYLWKTEVERLRELACDRAVIARRRLGVGAYCACLLTACQNALGTAAKAGGGHKSAVRGLPVVGLVPLLTRRRAARGLRRRVVSLIEAEATARPRTCGRRRTGWMLVSLLLPLVLMIEVASIAIQRPADWSHDRLMLATIVNLDRMRPAIAVDVAAPPITMTLDELQL